MRVPAAMGSPLLRRKTSTSGATSVGLPLEPGRPIEEPMETVMLSLTVPNVPFGAARRSETQPCELEPRTTASGPSGELAPF